MSKNMAMVRAKVCHLLSPKEPKNLSLGSKSTTSQMCTVCLASRGLWARWRKLPSPLTRTSLEKSQNGSMGTSWETGRGSSRSETRRQCNTLKALLHLLLRHTADSCLLLPSFLSGSTTGLMVWLSCTSSKYPVVEWPTKAASCPAPATKPMRRVTASQCRSLVLSPCRTPAKTSSSALFQDSSYQVRILSKLHEQEPESFLIWRPLLHTW